MGKILVLIQNTGLILLSLLLSLGVGELILQQTSIGYYSHNWRVLFYTQPSFELLGEKAVHYAPNTPIRTTAVYGEKIDYDTTNTTNDMGFYDNVSYLNPQADTRKIVFLGDSFTSGSGGDKPWVTQLRDSIQAPSLELYNFGVSGTGIINFYNLLNQTYSKFKFDEVNIMLISSDLYRAEWYPVLNDEGMRMCLSDYSTAKCIKSSKPVMHTISHTDNDAQILDHAKQLYSEMEYNADSHRRFYQKLRVFNLACNALNNISDSDEWLIEQCPHLRLFRARKFFNFTLYRFSRDVLRKMRAEYPDTKIRMFHIPEKGEVYRGWYSVDIKQTVEDMGITYIPLISECDWSSSMYHKHDGHPNNSGYKNLTECMAKYIH